MLNWCRQFNIFCFLDSHEYKDDQSDYDWLLAAGCRNSVSLDRKTGFEKLRAFSLQHKDWMFGHFGYEFTHVNETSQTANELEVNFGDGFFFIPEMLICCQNNEISIECTSFLPESIFNEIQSCNPVIEKNMGAAITLQHGITANEYKTRLQSIKKHILRGDCYEINFCQSFYAKDAVIDPFYFYMQLVALSPNPFSAFYRLDDLYCLCASPERFLKKTGETIISQPIKGTAKRNLSDNALDEINRKNFASSEKEKSENVMIVDLVRNDLSKVCMKGSVQVKELFGIYSFPQVHQMISSIEGKVDPSTEWTEIIKACFPMGSMTGAPKKKVMELIDKYEQFPRGLFSGSIGYITPQEYFDFNVVIRSLMYDSSKKLISFKAGGGITFNSDIDKEYEESLLKADYLELGDCVLLKAEAIFKTLQMYDV